VIVFFSLLTSDGAVGSKAQLLAEICAETNMRTLTALGIAILASANAVAADRPAVNPDTAAIVPEPSDCASPISSSVVSTRLCVVRPAAAA
jgi:hypothetical protein